MHGATIKINEKQTVEVGTVVQSYTFCVLVKRKCKSFPFHLLLFKYSAELLWLKRAAVKARKMEDHYIIGLIIVLSVCLSVTTFVFSSYRNQMEISVTFLRQHN
jgi:hypothetical protein